MSGLRIFIILLVFLSLVGHGYGIFARNSRLPGFEYGLYNFEQPEKISGRSLRWSGKDSCQLIHASTEIMGITAYCPPENIDPSGLILSIYLDGKLLDYIYFTNGGMKHRYYYISSKKSRDMEIKTSVSSTYNPYKIGLSDDLKYNREQSVALGEIKFLQIMLEDGIGFFGMETEDKGQLPGWPVNMPAQFRWTGMQATIPSNPNDYSGNKKKISQGSGMVLFLKCNQPKTDENPVVVSLFNNMNINPIQKIKLKDHQWQKVSIEPSLLKQSKAITIKIGGIRNSELLNMHSHALDKGLAVAIFR